MDSTELLTPATGPGGTVFLVRPKLTNGRLSPKPEPRESVGTQRTAWLMRQAVEDASRALAGGEAVQREELRVKLETAQHDRQQFWMDTCREAREMKNASVQARELYRQHGCCFGVPSSQQVQCVLEALDSALPGWERDHSELFYVTLRLNFPELPKRQS